MTDDPSVETHDHEETLSATEVVHEPPSDYEFADEHSSAAADEHTEEHTPLPSDSDIKPSKRSPLLPIIAAVGGVLVLGAAAWWQFGGNSSSQSTSPVASNTYMPAPAAVVPGAPKAIVSPPVPSLPVAPTTAAAGSDSTTLEATSTQPASAVMPSGMPSAGDSALPRSADVTSGAMPLAMPTPPPTPSAATAMPASVTAAPVSGGADQRIDALTARIDALQKALDQANIKLSQMTNMVASTGTTASPKDMQNRLDAMEQELAQMKHSSSPPLLAAPATVPTEGMMGDHVAMPMMAPTTSHMSKHKLPQAHKTKMAHKIKKKLPTVSEAPVHMILRAAVPGQAWIATSATSQDLKQVQVGDIVPGIGKVTAIQQQGDSWVVQGTKASLK